MKVSSIVKNNQVERKASVKREEELDTARSWRSPRVNHANGVIIPAKAGVPETQQSRVPGDWIPASAGMTDWSLLLNNHSGPGRPSAEIDWEGPICLPAVTVA